MEFEMNDLKNKLSNVIFDKDMDELKELVEFHKINLNQYVNYSF